MVYFINVQHNDTASVTCRCVAADRIASTFSSVTVKLPGKIVSAMEDMFHAHGTHTHGPYLDVLVEMCDYFLPIWVLPVEIELKPFRVTEWVHHLLQVIVYSNQN